MLEIKAIRVLPIHGDLKAHNDLLMILTFCFCVKPIALRVTNYLIT